MCSQDWFVKILKAMGTPGMVERPTEAAGRWEAMGGFDAGYVRVGGPVEDEE
jgi:hypothetical protein